MDGVVDLTVRAYDPNGFWMTNTIDRLQRTTNHFNQNTFFFRRLVPADGLEGVRLLHVQQHRAGVGGGELGVLEDTTLQRAEGLSGAAQLNYLSNHVGQVHLFRQRVAIRNVDPTAYQ